MGTIIKTNQQIIWLINDINFEVRNTYNKALCSLHDTQLDD